MKTPLSLKHSERSALPLIFLINGPNLNLLGLREPHLYGGVTYEVLIDQLTQKATNAGLALRCEQSNHEGVLIDRIHEAHQCGAGIIINPGAYGHTSIALRDALLAVDLPTIEIHITNIARRESFRHHSYISDVVLGTLSGFGVYGYELALNAMINILNQ